MYTTTCTTTGFLNDVGRLPHPEVETTCTYNMYTTACIPLLTYPGFLNDIGRLPHPVVEALPTDTDVHVSRVHGGHRGLHEASVHLTTTFVPYTWRYGIIISFFSDNIFMYNMTTKQPLISDKIYIDCIHVHVHMTNMTTKQPLVIKSTVHRIHLHETTTCTCTCTCKHDQLQDMDQTTTTKRPTFDL